MREGRRVPLAAWPSELSESELERYAEQIERIGVEAAAGA